MNLQRDQSHCREIMLQYLRDNSHTRWCMHKKWNKRDCRLHREVRTLQSTEYIQHKIQTLYIHLWMRKKCLKHLNTVPTESKKNLWKIKVKNTCTDQQTHRSNLWFTLAWSLRERMTHSKAQEMCVLPKSCWTTVKPSCLPTRVCEQ